MARIHDRLADRSKAQLIVIYGRRRIGKSTLIAKAVAGERNVLKFEGIEGARKQEQIAQFLDDLAEQTGRVRLAATSWREVFRGLGEIIRTGRWVLVFDEFPWMGGGRTRIVSELKLYWDRWIQNPEVCLFLCGSVASFMSSHVLHSKALHNRKTLEMCLGPLTPRESGEFIAKRGSREKAQLYMTLGGVPKYLEQIDPNRSLAHNINRLCFTANGFFLGEFETLFKEQFLRIKVYEAVARSLAEAPGNLSDLARRIGVEKGGGLNQQLGNLARAQFIRSYVPVKLGDGRRSRTKVFKLIDPFLHFFFRYMQPNLGIIARNHGGENLFSAIAGPTIKQYYGYAFERLCEDAMIAIIDRLGLALVDIREMGPYFRQRRGAGNGVQIDWIILQRESIWTLMEFKYSSSPQGLSVVDEVERKMERLAIPSEISVEKVLVSAVGATSAVKSRSYFNRIIELEDLV